MTLRPTFRTYLESTPPPKVRSMVDVLHEQ